MDKRAFLNVKEPVAVHCTINAGYVPADSWVYDPDEGGGRIIGEVCHFIDLIQYITEHHQKGFMPKPFHLMNINQVIM